MKLDGNARSSRSPTQRVVILALAVLQIVVTFLPSFGIGEPIADRSDAATTLITPAGWAFAIWGPLYFGSIVYALYQLLSKSRGLLLAQIGWWSAGAFLGNAIWALYTQFLGLSAGSALIIVATLLCLLHVYRVFAAAGQPFTAAERFLVVLPLSALAAWLTAATIVNVAATLKYYGVDASEAAPLVAAAVIITGGIIAAVAVWRGRGNPWYALVFTWALAAIYSAGGELETEVRLAAAGALLLVAIAAGVRLSRKSDRAHWFSAKA
jgi:hypothetical protein